MDLIQEATVMTQLQRVTWNLVCYNMPFQEQVYITFDGRS